jgi:glyoxylase-like metal-dependent hydrolase (beta-lactamase superfamily II)
MTPRTPQTIHVLLVLLVVIAGVPAASSDEQAQSIVDRAIAAHGGRAVEQLGSIVQEWRTTDTAIFESRRPGPPWDTSQRWQAFAADFESGRFAEAAIERAGGYEWITGLLIDRKAGYRVDYRTETYRVTTTSFDNAVLDMATWSPVVLLRWLSERRQSIAYAGRQEIDDGTVEAIVVEVGGEKISVLVDSASGQVRALERSYIDYDGTRVPMRFRYVGTATRNGLIYPERVELWINDYLAREGTLVEMHVGTTIDSYLRLPDAFRPTPNEPDGIRDFRIEELADGLYFVGNGVMYQLMVEYEDFVVALDGCSGDVARRVEVTRDRIPGKEFRYVLASHHHNDHLHGLDDFARIGATIIASPEHKDTIVDYIRTVAPEVTPDFLFVDDGIKISSDTRELQVIDIGPVPHSDNMLVAYLPREKILFVADLFVLGGSREPVKPASQNAIALLQAIERLGLDIDRIVDPHSPVISRIDDLRNAVALHEAGGGVFDRARDHLDAWRSARQ